MDFSDPPNTEKIISEFRSLSDKEEIQTFIHKVLPGWLVFTAEKYSDDYPYLQDNWQRICSMLQVSPKKIVLVSDIKFDNEHTVSREFCEFMTQKGYCVRRVSEFCVCAYCNSAIPLKSTWEHLLEKGLPVPRKWIKNCRSCEKELKKKSKGNYKKND
jgi:hypothetical protein